MQTPLDDFNSDDLTRDTHAFIIRIWKEETGQNEPLPVWRGHITHAYTGERRFFQELNSLLDFIKAYLVTKTNDQK
jgi:hypothetical protein